MIDVEQLLREVEPDAPCGPDLVYDPAFTALEWAARGRPDQQFGETTLTGSEPDWNDVREKAVALFERTKDLRVALMLARALVRLEQVEGLAAGMRLVQGLLERYWDYVHPVLDPDDGLDPTMRLNVLAMLGDLETFVRDTRNVDVLGPGRHGPLAIRSVLVALGKWTPGDGETALSRAEIESMLRAAVQSEGPAKADALREAAGSVVAIQALLAEKVGVEQIPDIKVVGDMLAAVRQLYDSVLGKAVESGVTSDAGGEAAAAPETLASQVTSVLRTRQDAVLALQRVTEFIERTEPSNPAPLFIRRAQRLMDMSFAEIIQDLVPESLGQVQKLAGLKSEL